MGVYSSFLDFGKNRKTGSVTWRTRNGTGSSYLIHGCNKFLQTLHLNASSDRISCLLQENVYISPDEMVNLNKCRKKTTKILTLFQKLGT